MQQNIASNPQILSILQFHVPSNFRFLNKQFTLNQIL